MTLDEAKKEIDRWIGEAVEGASHNIGNISEKFYHLEAGVLQRVLNLLEKVRNDVTQIVCVKKETRESCLKYLKEVGCSDLMAESHLTSSMSCFGNRSADEYVAWSQGTKSDPEYAWNIVMGMLRRIRQ